MMDIVMKVFIGMVFLHIMISFVSCGYNDSQAVRVEYEDEDTVPYTFDEMKSTCGKCHPGSAPAIPLDEAGFKSSPKVLSEIESGDMPPTAGSFDKKKAIAFMKGTK